MPRTARQNSESGVYHVVVRGVNKQQIFECDEDYRHFVNILKSMCGADDEPRHCYIYAWCLMGNHVHLLIKMYDEPTDPLFIIMFGQAFNYIKFDFNGTTKETDIE